MGYVILDNNKRNQTDILQRYCILLGNNSGD